MQLRPGFEINTGLLETICKRYAIRSLATFGSVANESFGNDSDIDVLVEIDPHNPIGLITLAKLELELSEVFHGREVEVRTLADLSPLFRDEVKQSARTLYAAA